MKFKSLFLLGLSALTLPIILSSCEEKKPQKEIGIQLYSVREDMKADPRATVIKVGEMGYSFVETAGYADGKFYGMDPMEFKALVEENNMKFLGSHTGKDLPDSSNYEQVMAWWDTCIAAHKAAGVEYIVQPWMGKAGYESIGGLKAFCVYFEKVGEKCNAQGIRFGYHNHAKEFAQLDSITIYDFMLQNTDPAKVMFQMDLYWVVEGGANPVVYFEKYPGRFELWHVKDKEEIGASGKIDFAAIYAHKEKSGMKRQIVEVERYNYPPLESIKMSLDFLMNADYVK